MNEQGTENREQGRGNRSLLQVSNWSMGGLSSNTRQIRAALLLAVTMIMMFTSLALPIQSSLAQRNELRAFWVDAFNTGFKTPEQVDQLLDDVEAANANAIIVQVRRRADVYYQSSIEPRAQDAALAPAPYDPLRTLIDRAHSRGIEVHAWIATLTVWKTSLGAPPPGHILMSHGVGAPVADDWVMRANDGAAVDSEGNTWLDPGHPAVVTYTDAIARELLERYPDVDGLHLDRIRYPGGAFGYNPTAIARFNAQYNRAGAPDPADPLWASWRRAQVTALVQRIALSAAELAPQARFSAAVIAWGDGPDQVGGWQNSAPYKQVFQDWAGWLQSGLLDTAVVMNYDRQHDPKQRAYFANWVAWETDKAGGSIIVGPAAYLNSIQGTLEQVTVAQAAGANGIAFYSYATTNKDAQPRSALISALASGPFAAPAEPPPMPWKAQTGGLTGALNDLAALKNRDGVTVTLTGPETRTVQSDGTGWFGAPRLAPGEYVAFVALSGERYARANATVKSGTVARLTNWSEVTLTERYFLPLTLR